MSFTWRKVLTAHSEPSYTALPKDIDDEPHDSSSRIRVLVQRLWLRVTVFLALFLLLMLGLTLLGKSFQIDDFQSHIIPKGLYRAKRLVVFQENSLFNSLPSSESNRAWDQLMPLGRGYILVSGKDRQSVGQGISVTQNSDRYGLAVFHQIHCLGMIRDAFYADGNMSEPGMGHHIASHTQRDSADHLRHCFDYLRQSIMCSADLTLESARVEKDGSRRSVDGWGVQHQCRDWDAIRSWSIDHRGYDKSGIMTEP